MRSAVTLLRAFQIVLAGIATCCGSDGGAPTSPPTPGPAATPAQPDLGRLNMTLLAHLDLQALTGRAASGSGNWGYTAPSGRRFALTGTSVGLSIVEVTDPRRPQPIRLIEGPASSWREVKTYGQYLYVTTEAQNHGLDIIDMANPDRPVKVQTWREDFVTAHTLWIDAKRGLLFANGAHFPNPAGGDLGLYVLDIRTNPREPKFLARFDEFAADGFYIHDSYSRGGILFGSAIQDGFLAFLDVSDLANIRRIGQFNTGCRFPHNSWPTDDGRFLFTTDERSDCPVEGWDISGPAPVKVSQYIAQPFSVPHNVMVDGDRLLIAHYTEGAHLLDVSDPVRPRLMGFYDTYTGNQPFFHGCWGAYIFPGSDLIVASDIEGGLFVIGYTGS